MIVDVKSKKTQVTKTQMRNNDDKPTDHDDHDYTDTHTTPALLSVHTWGGKRLCMRRQQKKGEGKP